MPDLAVPPYTTTAQDKAEQRRAAEQNVFIREVDDALRQDQISGFAQNYGKSLLIAAAVGLAGFGGFLYWQYHQKRATEERSEQLVQALDSVNAGKLDEAKAKLQPLSADNGASGANAKLLLAGIALEQKRGDDALKLYREVEGNERFPQPLRDLATVREVAANFDKMKPQDVIDRLKPLAAKDSAWFGPAGEMVAVAYLKQGKKKEAGDLLASIGLDKDVSADLRSRAGQLAAELGADSVPDVVDDKGQALDEAARNAKTEATDGDNKNG